MPHNFLFSCFSVGHALLVRYQLNDTLCFSIDVTCLSLPEPECPLSIQVNHSLFSRDHPIETLRCRTIGMIGQIKMSYDSCYRILHYRITTKETCSLVTLRSSVRNKVTIMNYVMLYQSINPSNPVSVFMTDCSSRSLCLSKKIQLLLSC